MEFVTHVLATQERLPKISTNVLYEYVIARSMIFVRARRQHLSAMIPVSPIMKPIFGLSDQSLYVSVASKVPASLLVKMLTRAYHVGNRECMFYLSHQETAWRAVAPRQFMDSMSVRPVDPYCPEGADALIEVHSHHGMKPFFSGQDNKDERTGFRIYSVLGNLSSSRPAILTRVGIYGHFCEIPSSWIYCLPAGLEDTCMDISEVDDEY